MKATLRDFKDRTGMASDELSIRLDAETPDEETLLFKIFAETSFAKKKGIYFGRVAPSGSKKLSMLALTIEH